MPNVRLMDSVSDQFAIFISHFNFSLTVGSMSDIESGFALYRQSELDENFCSCVCLLSLLRIVISSLSKGLSGSQDLGHS